MQQAVYLDEEALVRRQVEGGNQDEVSADDDAKGEKVPGDADQIPLVPHVRDELGSSHLVNLGPDSIANK